MQQAAGNAFHHRLEVQLETLLTQRLMQQSMPGVVIVTDLRYQTLIDARPILLALPFGLLLAGPAPDEITAPAPAPEPEIIAIGITTPAPAGGTEDDIEVVVIETGWTDPAAVEAIGVVHLSGDTDPALFLLP